MPLGKFKNHQLFAGKYTNTKEKVIIPFKGSSNSSLKINTEGSKHIVISCGQSLR
jgi:hypothetical protein